MSMVLLLHKWIDGLHKISPTYAQFEEEFPYEDTKCDINESFDEEYEKNGNSSYDSYDDEPLLIDLHLQPSQDISVVKLEQEDGELYFSKELLSEIESKEDESREDEVRRKKRMMRFPQFKEDLGFKNVSFEVGMEFRNLDVFKKVARDYCVAAGVKSMHTWVWFLRKLVEDIGLGKDGIAWSFIFDKQKGLVPTIVEIFPDSEHRFCAYHIYHNYAKQFKGKELKDLLWKCAKSTTMRDFECSRDALKQLNDKA
ncbi:hypothetical protein L6164_008525 [Bauhinia variegata]|uniref:Uncharacterized protein n=1 Tax=Bauhinia variegata TaxID=167791 RepID=A0ACB9PG03_BAUVA|nr:hypothetical protein L6164_008525 [Bauhinia variegata]